MTDEEFVNDKLKHITILAIAIISGIVLFAVAAAIVGFNHANFINRFDEHFRSTLYYVLLIFSVCMVYLARFMYNRRMQLLNDTMDKSELLDKYRNAIVLHAVICELPAIAGIIGSLLFGGYIFFLPVAMSLIELARKFPQRSKIEEAIGTFI